LIVTFLNFGQFDEDTPACHHNNCHLWLMVTLFFYWSLPSLLASHLQLIIFLPLPLPSPLPPVDCYNFFFIIGHLLAMPLLLSDATTASSGLLLVCLFVGHLLALPSLLADATTTTSG